MQANRRARLDNGCKGQSLQDGCGLFAWKFFQTQQQGHGQADEPLSAYVVTCLMLSSDPVQLLVTLADIPGDSTPCLELIP
ncbi:hypothetical protein TNCV_346731 [Trichonephila clavipes]|nr:hypothetical protein TNCV_346731 [Trichonephila clavipes]